MRFSAAVGALLSQYLPSAARAKFEDRAETALFERQDGHPNSFKSLVENGQGKLFWRIRNGKGDLKLRLTSLLENRKHNGVHTLRNVNAIHQADGAECDPFSSSMRVDADVGILKCGVESYCKVDKTSSLGGVCKPTSSSKGRLLQGSAFQYAYDGFCNENSDYFIDNLNCTTTCDGFDPGNGVGSFSCTDGCLEYVCQQICLSYESHFFASGPDNYGYETCYGFSGPNGVKSICYGITAEGNLNGTVGCTVSWNGNDCACTYGDNVTVDCPDGQSSITGTIEYLTETFLEINECVGDEENVCSNGCPESDEIFHPPDSAPGSIPKINMFWLLMSISSVAVVLCFS